MTEAELLARARAFVDGINLWNMTSQHLVWLFASFAQSERARAAPRQVAYDALLANLRDYGVAFRMIRDAVMELSPAVPPIKERDVGPPDYAKDAEEIIAGFSSAVEAAAAEARQEMLGVLRTVENATASPFYTDKERKAIKHCFDAVREGIADLRALASPAPQEETW